MEHKLKIHIGSMFILSIIIGYVFFGVISPPDIGAVYGVGFIMGRAVSSTLVPVIIVSLPALIYKYFKKESMPAYTISLWAAWSVFLAISLMEI